MRDVPKGVAIRLDALRGGLRVFGVLNANFPRVLTEDAQEPDDRPVGRVWYALDERAVAHGAARRQARRSGSIAHVSECRSR